MTRSFSESGPLRHLRWFCWPDHSRRAGPDSCHGGGRCSRHVRRRRRRRVGRSTGRRSRHRESDHRGRRRVLARCSSPELRSRSEPIGLGLPTTSSSWMGRTSNVSRDVTLSIGRVSDTLIVTASRGPESRTSVTQSLSVISRADIQALGTTELSDVLRFVPGTSVEGTGREGGGPTSLFVRGGDSDYNVVLIDGVRANLDGGRFDFSRVAAGEIERVEVLRGAQSSLWGADAMTSVVQIITKRASPTSAPEVSGSFEAARSARSAATRAFMGGQAPGSTTARPSRAAGRMARSRTSCRKTIDTSRRHSTAGSASRSARRPRLGAACATAMAMARSSDRSHTARGIRARPTRRAT